MQHNRFICKSLAQLGAETECPTDPFPPLPPPSYTFDTVKGRARLSVNSRPAAAPMGDGLVVYDAFAELMTLREAL